MRKFSTIDEVVTDIMSGIGLDPEGRGYEQMLRVLMRSLDDLHYNTTPNVESKIFTVESNGTIPWPSNSYKILSAGLCLTDGTVAILGKTQQSPIAKDLPDTCTCDGCSGVATVNSSTSTPNVCADCLFFNYIEGDSYHGELYGFVEEGYPYGRYYDNEFEARVEFDGRINPGSRIVLSYQTAVDKYTHKLIAVDDYQLVRAHVLWNYFEASNPRKANGFRLRTRLEISKLKRRKERHTYTDWIDAMTSNYNNAVR